MTRRDLLAGLACVITTCASSVGFTWWRLAAKQTAAHPCDVCGAEASELFRVGIEWPDREMRMWRGVVGHRINRRCGRHPASDVIRNVHVGSEAEAEALAVLL